MKVYIGPYRNNYNGYALTKKIFFWVDPFQDKKYRLFDAALKFFSYFNPVFRWLNRIDNRKINIHIDNYDVWNMDHTLALIIYPMLVKYKEIGISYGYIDNDDVPKNLRVSKSLKDENKISKIKEKQWQWFLDELIWTFATILDEEVDYRFNKELNVRVTNGLRLFGKYYSSLWD